MKAGVSGAGRIARLEKVLGFSLIWISLLLPASTPAQPVPMDLPPTQTPAISRLPDSYQPGPGWELVWADEFDGDALNEAHWTRQVLAAGTFNEEWQRYTASEENAFVADHCLVLQALHTAEAHAPGHYTSARLHTAQKLTWKHGKIAARIRLPRGPGVWPAFWMLGANCDENGGDTPWPHCGEIDIMELYGSKDDAVVEANLHYANAEGVHEQMGAVAYELEQGIFADGFHVFEIEWDSARIVWKVDGQAYASADLAGASRSAFHEEFFILLNLAIGGTWAGAPDATTGFPQRMEVDWVRVYEPGK